jgi:hypothetical protein
VPCYLIDHPGGKVLFDTGLHPSLAVDPGGRLGALGKFFDVEFTPEEVVSARLAAVGVEDRRGRLVAPVDGVVLTPNLSERVGSWLEAGEVLMQVSPLDTLRVEIGVSESDVARIRPGQPLRVKVLGFPDRQFRGRVDEVAWLGEPTHPGRPAVFKVLGHVANPNGLLKSGMTGRARIDVTPDTLLSRWARGLWRWLRMSFWM